MAMYKKFCKRWNLKPNRYSSLKTYKTWLKYLNY